MAGTAAIEIGPIGRNCYTSARVAADHQPLLDFIDAAKRQGASDEFVVALLQQNGWSEKRIYQAFSIWYEAQTGRAVPNGGGRMEAAKDAFLYLLSFITLGIWTIQLGALLFSTIDRAFPNPALAHINSAFVSRMMANQLASVMVAFPLFLLVMRRITTGAEQQPERLESSVRKWLTYIALVIAASVMIGDVVTFLAYFLRGDLSTRFILKILTVLVIAGGVFAYFLQSLHREKASSNRDRWFALAATAIVGLGLVVGFSQIGSPALQRLASEDSRRLADLSSLAEGLHSMWQRRQNEFVLPPTAQSVITFGVETRTIDPLSRRPYEYTPLQGTSYRLCAVFSRPSPNDVPKQWHHASGKACFVLDARDTVQMVQPEW